MSQPITIAELTPNTKGNFTLKFEVAEIGVPLANPQQIESKIVDETGCIDAYFNNFGKFIKVGGVYQLISFKCKVVEHSLRIQLRKDSKLTRIKHQFAFKDLFNNLSEKFYVSKPVLQNSDPENHQENGPKKQETKNFASKNSKEIKTEQKVDNKQIQVSDKKDTKHKPLKQQNNGFRKDKKIITNTEKESKNENHKNEPQKKKIYVQKLSQQDSVVRGNEKFEGENRQQRTLLRDIYKFQQRSVNLIVRILSKTKIDYDKYHLIKVSDSSGAVYAEFQSRIDVQEDQWYSIKNFKVYRDKEYGFVVSQIKQSSWEVIYDFNEKPNFKLIDLKKQ